MLSAVDWQIMTFNGQLHQGKTIQFHGATAVQRLRPTSRLLVLRPHVRRQMEDHLINIGVRRGQHDPHHSWFYSGIKAKDQ